MSDGTIISSQLALAGALISAVVTIVTLLVRARNKERLKALDGGSASAAAVVADAVPMFRLNTKNLKPQQVTDIVRHEIESRDRRNWRFMFVSVVAIVVFGTLVIVLGKSSPPGPDAHTIPAPSVTTDTTTMRDGQRDGAIPDVGACPQDMVEIPGGTFAMGDERNKPVHDVELSPYCIDITEVTVGAYNLCAKCRKAATMDDCNAATGKDKYDYPQDCETLQFCNVAGHGKDDHPQNCVSWDDANEYCASVDKHLPTEAQWEYAARGGKDRLEYPWGKNSPNACSARKTGTCVVRYAAGAFGLYDMAGNVWEWVVDRHGDYTDRFKKDPGGAMVGQKRVVRGGAWNTFNATKLRGAARGDPLLPATRSAAGGFRCAKTKE